MKNTDSFIERCFPKYGDYFGQPLMMAYENLGFEYATYSSTWKRIKRIEHAAKDYYYRYNQTLEDSLKRVELDDDLETRIAIAKCLQGYFGEDAWYYFVMRGNKNLSHCEQRQINDKEPFTHNPPKYGDVKDGMIYTGARGWRQLGEYDG